MLKIYTFIVVLLDAIFSLVVFSYGIQEANTFVVFMGSMLGYNVFFACRQVLLSFIMWFYDLKFLYLMIALSYTFIDIYHIVNIFYILLVGEF